MTSSGSAGETGPLARRRSDDPVKVVMRALRDGKGTVVGEAQLGLDGVVVFRGEAKPGPDDPTVFDVETFDVLTPADGQRYLRALPHTFRSPYFRAELVN